MNPIALLDYAGVAVFAATGALAASRKQLDIIGFLFLASVTGIGGGTFRDLILNVPVFWVANPDYVLICAAVAVLVFFSAHRVEFRYKLLLWLDAIGLAAFSVMGAAEGPGRHRFAGRRRHHRHADRHVRRHSARSAGRRAVGAAAGPKSTSPPPWPAPRIYVFLDLAGMPAGFSAPLAFIAGLGGPRRRPALWLGLSALSGRPGRRPEDIL